MIQGSWDLERVNVFGELFFSSSASFFIIWHLPLQCILGRFRLTQSLAAMYSLLIWYSAMITHLLNVCSRRRIIKNSIPVNFMESKTRRRRHKKYAVCL